jgi:hypothetical protein
MERRISQIAAPSTLAPLILAPVLFGTALGMAGCIENTVVAEPDVREGCVESFDGQGDLSVDAFVVPYDDNEMFKAEKGRDRYDVELPATADYDNLVDFYEHYFSVEVACAAFGDVPDMKGVSPGENYYYVPADEFGNYSNTIQLELDEIVEQELAEGVESCDFVHVAFLEKDGFKSSCDYIVSILLEQASYGVDFRTVIYERDETGKFIDRVFMDGIEDEDGEA